MGQHSRKPTPQDRKLTAGKRWITIAAGAAVVAAASTAAWAAMDTADSPNHPSGSPTPLQAKPLNEAARQATPQSPSPLPKPAAARPKPTKHSATAQPNTTGSPTAASSKPTTQPAATERPAAGSATAEPASPTPSKTTKSPAHKPKTRVLSSGTCGASYYGEPQMTASGERFDPSAMTAAHKTLPLGSKVRVTNPDNGESVTVRINDRGPYVGGRCLDLSEAAFAAIGNTSAGVMRVKYEVLSR
ncbi:septal ring lytic transglycosylase RlpA family protein [Nonomuraea sp. NPDC050153]|uniref:septal ring lytic transglycosylase RlpA family protein n=1 Tax=Nonomuraea sp. NPDC050153 TaxID=3364359 RepID=UPI0037AE1F0D